MRKLYYQFRITFSILIFFIFGIQLSFAQPTNNDCSGAILLTASTNASCNPYSATTNAATQTMAAGLCNGKADDDVWFTFVAASTTQVITVYGMGLQDSVIELFSGSCGSLTYIACSDGSYTLTESLLAGSLVIGTTYYVRVYSYGTGQAYAGAFNICVTTLDNPAPYCAAPNNHPPAQEYIKNFSTTLGTSNISNLSSGFSTNGYGNFTSQSVVANPNSTINFSCTFAGYDQSLNIWVDWNNDKDFLDAGEKVFASGSSQAFFSGSITIPTGTLPGNYRMRIRSAFFNDNPTSCGTYSNGGETEDYTFTVFGSTCTTIPMALVATGITATSATVSWTAPNPAPAGGYVYYYSTNSTPPTPSTTGSGSTAAGVTTSLLSGLSPGTTYYVWVRSNCGSVDGLGAWSSSISFTTLLEITNVDICAGASGSLAATGNCSGSTSSMTINGAWNTNPKAKRIVPMTNSPICDFSSVDATYSVHIFQVSITGSYTFTMAENSDYDGMAYLVKESFTPGQCGPADTWIVGDDDSGPGISDKEPKLTTELTAGVTYKLISTAWTYASNTSIIGAFQYSVIGPTGGAILTPNPGVIQWYTASSGGTSIGTGSSFNPVGVTGSGLANTNTPGTTIFYAACSLNPSLRTPVNFVIRPKATATISALGTLCNSDGELSIAFTGNAPWSIVYTDDLGSPSVSVSGILTSPHVITVNPTSEVT